jgi:hypothetical protein
MTSKSWGWFIIIQLFVVNAITLPWFFHAFPDDWTTVMVRYVYFLLGWGIIIMAIFWRLKTRQEERWQKPKEAWRSIPEFPDYDISQDGDVRNWDGNLVMPTSIEGRIVWYELLKSDEYHWRSREALLIDAFDGLVGRRFNK